MISEAFSVLRDPKRRASIDAAASIEVSAEEERPSMTAEDRDAIIAEIARDMPDMYREMLDGEDITHVLTGPRNMGESFLTRKRSAAALTSQRDRLLPKPSSAKPTPTKTSDLGFAQSGDLPRMRRRRRG